jgi:hypothetical protein
MERQFACQATAMSIGEHQISDISRFWVNDVTLMKLLKIANRNFTIYFNCVGESTEKLLLYR